MRVRGGLHVGPPRFLGYTHRARNPHSPAKSELGSPNSTDSPPHFGGLAPPAPFREVNPVLVKQALITQAYRYALDPTPAQERASTQQITQ